MSLIVLPGQTSPLVSAESRARQYLSNLLEPLQTAEEEEHIELMQNKLAPYMREAWHIVEPATPLVWNWHLDAIADHLDAVTEGQILRLLINVPPGHMKSLITSVFWPSWMWIKRPWWRAIFASYGMDLALRDSDKCREIIESEWYQQNFQPGWQLSKSQNAKSYYRNTVTGSRTAVSVGGKTTGFRSHAVVVDDPLNVTESYSDASREKAILWLDQAATNRLSDMRTGAVVIIMQRLHERDPAGHVLAQGGYTHLCLPSRFEPLRKSVTFTRDKCKFWEDPRTEEDEPLFKEMFPDSVLEEEERRLGPYGFAGQHQQRPSPASGGIFRQHWYRYWCWAGMRAHLPDIMLKNEKTGEYDKMPVVELPPLAHWQAFFDLLLQSWDMAFKGDEKSAYVVGQVWAKKGADKFLIDQIRDKLDMPATLAAVKALTGKWPITHTKLVEDKANGPAVISTLRSQISGLVPVPTGKDGKEARANAAVPQVAAGNVYLPHPAMDGASFFAGRNPTPDVLHESTAFPNAAFKDQVDAMCQALLYMESGAIWRSQEFLL